MWSRLAIAARLKALFDRRPVLVVCGDSHLVAIEAAYRAGKFKGRRMRFVRVGGATAIGLRHPKSKTQALARFRDALLPYRRDTVPVFQFGEVDCGFVIWHRAAKYGEAVEAQLAASLDAYRAFLAELKQAGYASMIVTSAVLPTLRDGALDGEVARLRSSVSATLRERTELTLEHNRRLRAIAEELALGFVDLDADLIDPRTGLVMDGLRHPDPPTTTSTRSAAATCGPPACRPPPTPCIDPAQAAMRF